MRITELHSSSFSFSFSSDTDPRVQPPTQERMQPSPRKVDVRLPGTRNSNSHGARPVHQIISIIKWIQTSRLSIKKPLSATLPGCTRPVNRREHAPTSLGVTRPLQRQPPPPSCSMLTPVSTANPRDNTKSTNFTSQIAASGSKRARFVACRLYIVSRQVV